MPNKSTIQFGKGTKLSPRFIGPFKIQESIGLVAYRLVLPSHLHKTHNVFHVSLLRHYVVDESSKLKLEGIASLGHGNHDGRTFTHIGP
jgi:hypothetical protein